MRSAILPALTLAAAIEGANARHGPFLVESIALAPTSTSTVTNRVEQATGTGAAFKTIDVEPLIRCKPAPGSNAIVNVNAHGRCMDDALQVGPPRRIPVTPPNQARDAQISRLPESRLFDNTVASLPITVDAKVVTPLPTEIESESQTTTAAPSSTQSASSKPHTLETSHLDPMIMPQGSHRPFSDHEAVASSTEDSTSNKDAADLTADESSSEPRAFEFPPLPPNVPQLDPLIWLSRLGKSSADEPGSQSHISDASSIRGEDDYALFDIQAPEPATDASEAKHQTFKFPPLPPKAYQPDPFDWIKAGEDSSADADPSGSYTIRVSPVRDEDVRINLSIWGSQEAEPVTENPNSEDDTFRFPPKVYQPDAFDRTEASSTDELHSKTYTFHVPPIRDEDTSIDREDDGDRAPEPATDDSKFDPKTFKFPPVPPRVYQPNPFYWIDDDDELTIDGSSPSPYTLYVPTASIPDKAGPLDDELLDYQATEQATDEFSSRKRAVSAPAIHPRILPPHSHIWGYPADAAASKLRAEHAGTASHEGGSHSSATAATRDDTATTTTVSQTSTATHLPLESQTTQRLWEHGEHTQTHAARNGPGTKSYPSADYDTKCHYNGLGSKACAFTVSYPEEVTHDGVTVEIPAYRNYDQFGQPIDELYRPLNGANIGEKKGDGFYDGVHNMVKGDGSVDNAATAQRPPTRLLCAAAFAVVLGVGLSVGLLI